MAWIFIPACCFANPWQAGAVPAGKLVTAVAAGGAHTCVLGAADGTPTCFGSDAHGQASVPTEAHWDAVHRLGDREAGARVDRAGYQALNTRPVRLSDVCAGGYHSCGVSANVATKGRLLCWGADFAGQAAPPADGEPGGFDARDPFVGVSCGPMYTCALRASGAPVCFGDGGMGQTTPPAGARFASLAAGATFACGLRGDGAHGPVHGLHGLGHGGGYRVACWGEDGHGQVSGAPPAERFASVAAGGDVACGVTSKGQLVCWGNLARVERRGRPGGALAGRFDKVKHRPGPDKVLNR